MKGPQVASLQKRLLALGYWVSSADGTYGHTTTQAVMALQKTAKLSRDGIAGPATFKALAASVKPSVRTRSGAVVEINKARQTLTYAVDGVVRWVFNTSTGTGKPFINEIKGTRGIAVTPSGTFRVQRQIAAWRKADLGQLYYPKYFNGGIAIHGAYSIPAYPASHGCARVSVPAMDFIWAKGIAPIGRKVVVY